MSFKNRETEQKYRAEYRAKNKERIGVYGRQWHNAHKDEDRLRLQKWRAANPERSKAMAKKSYLARDRVKLSKHLHDMKRTLRKELLDMYGHRCACCGESHDQFLTLDHVNGGGSQQRKTRGAFVVLKEAIDANDPAQFRILCFNCHLGAHANGGICPHKNPKGAKA